MNPRKWWAAKVSPFLQSRYENFIKLIRSKYDSVALAVRNESRFLFFVGVALAIVVLSWGAQCQRPQDECVAERAFVVGEYLTAAHVRGGTSAGCIGRVAAVAKRIGERVSTSELESVPDGLQVVAIPTTNAASFGSGAGVGMCVDVWVAGERIAPKSRIVAIAPLAGEQRLVYVTVADGEVKKLLTAAASEPAKALAFAACTAEAIAFWKPPSATPTPTATVSPTRTSTPTPTALPTLVVTPKRTAAPTSGKPPARPT